MHLQKLVDFSGIRAGTGGDALLAAVFQNIRIGALGLGHGRDDGDLAVEHLVVHTGRSHLVLHAGHAGHQPHDAAHAAHLLHLGKLVGEIVEVELALGHLLGHGAGFFRIDVFGGLFDQRDDVAHAENTVGDTARVELVEFVHALADTDQLDRLAGDGAHGEGRTAAAVAVHTGENEAGDADTFIEIASQIDGVLTGQRIRDQQDFMRIGLLLDVCHFQHQGFVDVRAAGGIENDDVMPAELGGLHGARGNIRRRLAGDDRQRVDAGLDAELAKLFLGGRTTRVERCHQHLLLIAVGQAFGDLAGGGGLARALQTHHHDDDGGGGVEIDGDAFGAEHLDKLVMHDLDDHLAGFDRLQDGCTNSFFTHPVGEGTHDFQCNVRFQKRTANLAQGGGNIGFRQRATAGQSIQNGTKAVLEVFKHRFFLLRSGVSETSVLSLPKTRRKAKKHPRAHRAVGC